MNEIISFLSASFEGHPYTFLFIGLLIGGETVLLPAIFAAFIGTLNLWAVSGLAVLAALVSDSAWYMVGRFVPSDIFSRLSFVQKHKPSIQSASERLHRNGLQYLFISKFIYGTRIIAQVLSGALKIPYYKFLAINTLGTVLLVGIIVFIGGVLEQSLHNLTSWRLPIFFLVFICITILIQAWIRKLIQKFWFRS